MAKMREHFFIVYDFESNGRRAKFVRILEKYGVRVQYSIFEFYLTKARKIELVANLQKLNFLEHVAGEAVMIIPIHQDTAKKITRFGNTVDILNKSGIFSI
jgi:CRISPR-associated endonuclease Cas2